MASTPQSLTPPRSQRAACRCLNVRVRYRDNGDGASSASSASSQSRTPRVRLDESESTGSAVTVAVPPLVGRELVSLGEPFTVPALRCLHCGTTVYAVEKAASSGPTRAVGFQARDPSPSTSSTTSRSASKDPLIRPHDGHVYLLPGLLHGDEIDEVQNSETFSTIYDVSIITQSQDASSPSSMQQQQRPPLTTQRSATSHYGLQGLPNHLVTTPPTSPGSAAATGTSALTAGSTPQPLASYLDATGISKLKQFRAAAEQEVMDLVRQKRRELDIMMARARQEAEAILEQAKSVPPPSTTPMMRGSESADSKRNDEENEHNSHAHIEPEHPVEIMPNSAFQRRPTTSNDANLSASLSALSASFALRGKESTMSQAEDWAQKRRLKERYPEGDHSVMTSAATSAATSAENSDSETIRRRRRSGEASDEEDEEDGEDAREARGRGRQRTARSSSADEPAPSRINAGTNTEAPGTKARPTMAPSSLNNSAGSKSQAASTLVDLGLGQDPETPRPGGRLGQLPPSASANVQLRPRNPPPSGAEPLKPATRQRSGGSVGSGDAGKAKATSGTETPSKQRKVAFAETPDHAPVALESNGDDGDEEEDEGREPVIETDAAVFDIDEELSDEGDAPQVEDARKEALQGGDAKVAANSSDLGGALDDVDTDAGTDEAADETDSLGGVPASVGAHHAGSFSALAAASGLDARRASLIDNFDPASLRRDGRIVPGSKMSPPGNRSSTDDRVGASRSRERGDSSPRRAIGYRSMGDAEMRLSGLLAPHAPSHRSLWRRQKKYADVKEEEEGEDDDANGEAGGKKSADAQWSAWQQRAKALEEAKVKRQEEEKARVLASSLPMQQRGARGIPVATPAFERDTSGFDREPKTSLPYQERQMVPSLRLATRRTSASGGAGGAGDRSSKPTLPTIADVEGDDVPKVATRGFAVAAASAPPTASMLSSATSSPSAGRRSPRPPYIPPPPPTSSTMVLQPDPAHRPRALTLFSVPVDERFAYNEEGEEEETDWPKVLAFMHRVEQLKVNKRTGWLHHRVPQAESIADHMYRMAMLAMLCPAAGIDVGKAVMLALVHDLAEAEVGDLTPLDGVSKEEKVRREAEALAYLVHDLLGSSPAALRIEALWKEYEERESLESILVKDLDRFELILQAIEYEGRHDIVDLQPFFGCSADVRHPRIRKWTVELAKERQAMWAAKGGKGEWKYEQEVPGEEVVRGAARAGVKP